jgi:dTDP-4-amino-4,6-dideoxygalactose transaminase
MARVATKDASLDTQVRACSLAIGALSTAKKADIIAIKAGYVSAVNFFHDALWVPFLADSDRDLKTKANVLQKGLSKKLKVNSAYIEKAKISTLDNILEQRKRSLRCFFGRLRNVDSKIEPDKNTGSMSERTYYNLHNDISALCTPADFDKIKSLFGEKVTPKARMKMLRDIVDKKSCKGWSPHQISMVNSIHDDVTARFNKPSSQAADYVATIH